ncbi:hypothetical protein PYW07_011203 [Mythimna separata]|uniref:Peptidase S1 domain-containing protein n=1 Tax=Mythimna separata TaxID=271217 RepID=A0AAD8DL33_MYTSE|nr:hypothetical protein PYW07_011203 [Mythimna separata]
MTVNKYLILLCTLSFWCSVTCDLNLSEGSPCMTRGAQGTCVNIFKCNSAALTYLYANAGFDPVEYKIPDLPDICSYMDNEPVVCCTDCDIGDEKYRNTAVGPYGYMVNKEGPVARQKCFEHFQSLPFTCRFPGNFIISKMWDNNRRCHTHSFKTNGVGFAAGGRNAERWEFPHVKWLEERKCHNHSFEPVYVASTVGGRNAEKWEFPHVALLGYGNDVESAQWLCGGSVISERFILTAAHCTSTRVLGSITYAALGLLKRSDPAESWKIYKIKRIIVHPEYKAPSKYHDIALLETETEIAFGRDLLPACLDIGVEWQRFADASGWGRLGHRQALADVLQVVNLEEFNETDCSKMYRPHRHLVHGYDHTKQMCYGSNFEIVDTCEGDSGGPLQVSNSKCLFHVIGVTSYGKDCGILGSAGMYTRVSYYVPWIESVVWPEEVEAKRKKDEQWLNKWLS